MLRSWIAKLMPGSAKGSATVPAPLLGDAVPPVTLPVPIPATMLVAPSGELPVVESGQWGSIFTIGMIHCLFFDAATGSGAAYDGMKAQGQTIPVSGHQALTSVMLDMYGANFPTTVNLPDLRGKAMWGPLEGMAPFEGTVPVTWHIATTNQPAPFGSGAAAPLAGMIMPLAGAGPIPEWLPCTRGTYDPVQYPALAAAIGSNFDTTRGNEGVIHAMPDLGWRVAMGAGGPITGSQGYTRIGDIMGEQSPEHTMWGLCINFLICLKGPWPITGGRGPIPQTGGWIGQLVGWGGTTAPADWAICDGSLLQIEAYQELFMLIGNQFGGDGETTFAVPDLRGKMLVGAA